MANFLSPLRVERLDGDKWRVLEEFDYHVGKEDSKVTVVVPAGFVTDFGSVPHGARELFPPVGGKADKAYVIHDMLYQFPWVRHDDHSTPYYMSVDRAFADSILKEAMGVLGCGWFCRWVVYSGVRIGGAGIWKRYREKDRIGL